MKRKKLLPLLALLFVVALVFIGIKMTQGTSLIGKARAKKFNIDLSTNNSYLQSVSFHGVSFMCPASWDVLKKVGVMYEISCVDNNSIAKRSVNFMWMNIEIPPEEWIEEGLKEAEDKLGSNKATVSSIKNSMFNTIKSKTIDISYTESDVKVYGKITSFNLKGSSCIVIMFNDSEIESDADFYAIEKSFEVK